MANFLLEIGTEEIPARMITSAAEELTRRVRDLLAREHLAEAAVVESFSTPRRLAVLAHGVAGAQPDISDQVLGPSLKVAYKDGQPTPAAHAFARKVNLELNALERISTPKGEYLAAKVLKKGREASALLAESLPKEVGSIYWPKNHVLARQIGGALCASGALDRGLARRQGGAGRVRRNRGGKQIARPPDFIARRYSADGGR